MVTRFIAGAALIWMAAALAAQADVPAAAEAPAAAAQKSGETPKAAEGEAAKGGAEELNPITFRGMNFPGDLTVWTAVVFVIVLLILSKAAWGPLSQGLRGREDAIAAQIAEAGRMNDDARRLLADYQQKLAASQDEVRKILDVARHDAEQVGRELLDKAKTDGAAERDRAVREIEAAANAAAKDLAERSAKIAVELAGKIVHQVLRPEDHARLIREAVADFSGRANGKK